MNLTQFNQATSSEPDSDTPHTSESDGSAAAEVREKAKVLLQDLHKGRHPKDNSPETTTDQFLNGLSYKDFPALCRAQAKLTVKAKDPSSMFSFGVASHPWLQH